MTIRKLIDKLAEAVYAVNYAEQNGFCVDGSFPIRVSQKQADYIVWYMDNSCFDYWSLDSEIDVDIVEDDELEQYYATHIVVDPKAVYELWFDFWPAYGRARWSLIKITDKKSVSGDKIWPALASALEEGRAEAKEDEHVEKRFPLIINQQEAEKVSEYLESEGFEFYFEGPVKVDPEAAYELWINFHSNQWGFKRKGCVEPNPTQRKYYLPPLSEDPSKLCLPQIR
jgi:hypothetical protein